MDSQARRRILFVTPWLASGGIERVLGNTVPWLVEHGYHCEVASWNVVTHLSGQPNAILDALSAAAVPVCPLTTYRRFTLIQRAAKIAAVVLKRGYRLLVGYELEGNLVVLVAKALLLGRVQVMAQIHNASRIHSELGTSPMLLRLAKRLYRHADLILAPSESIRLDSIRFFELDAQHVVTLHNPVPVERIRRVARQDPASLRPETRFVVGCGRLVRMKGFMDLIRAFAIVRRDGPLQLVILGEGPERGSLIQCARELGVKDEVIMPGFVPDPWPYFSRASAFVLSSLFGEAYPMVLLEAMVCSVPVIASRCEWGPEEILDQGRYGLLYDPGDVEGLAGHLRTLLNEPAVARAIASAASQRAEDFSDETILPSFERHCAALLSRAFQ